MAAQCEPAAVSYRVQSDDVRLQQSKAQVQTAELFVGKDPAPGGMYNANMGPTDMRHKCNSCHFGRRGCQGHPGHIQLPFPLTLPLAVGESRKWLRVVCLRCSALMADPTTNSRIRACPPSRKLGMAAAVSNTAGMVCANCGETHPKIVKTADDNFTYAKQWQRKGRLVEEPIYPYELDRIFKRISDESVRALGRDPLVAHPSSFLIHNLQVPPVSIRPAVRMMGPGGFGSSCHDINSILQYISKATEKATGGAGPVPLPPPGEPPREALVDQIMTLQQLVYDLQLGGSASATQRNTGKRGVVTGGRAIESIGRRLPRKKGRGRKHLAGKRVWWIGRDTISGRSQLTVEEVGIPESFARSLQVIETVTPENASRLAQPFNNGRQKYPGSTRVFRAATGTMHDVDGFRGGRLEPGDRLYRDVITGDYACFNRQPSLERSAINVHRVVVIRDIYSDSTLPTPPQFKTFQFNVIDTPLYNADFDGDEMNLIVIANDGARAEAEILGWVAEAFISTKTSGPVLGMVQDSTVGSKLLSTAGQMDKLHVMTLFERGRMPCDFSDMPPHANADGSGTIDGREVISRLFEQFPVSLEKRPTSFSETTEMYRTFRPEDTRTVMRRGRLVSGPLDKATVGSGAIGGVFHRISRVYGSQAAIQCIFALQQATIAHLNVRGFTVSLSDMLLPPENEKMVCDIVSGMCRESEIINEQLISRKIVAPLGLTVHDAYELKQIEALKVPDMILGPILGAIEDGNGMYDMVASGSKGNYKNIINIMGVVAQITINSRRIEPGTDGRTLAYFARGDMSPEASGFVRSNYVKGLTACEHYFGSMNGRNDLTNKALSTASTGYANRKSIMSAQSAIVGPTRDVCGPDLVSALYGDDGMDARHVEPIQFETVYLSDAEVREKFAVKGQADSAEEVAQLLEDRDSYRNVFLTTEQVNFSYAFSGKTLMAVNVRAIAQNHFGVDGPVASPARTTKQVAADLAFMRKRVAQFCERLPYLLLNSAQEEAGAPVPLYMQAAVAHIRRILRVELSTAKLKEYDASPPLLEAVFDAVQLRFQKSLVASGEAVGVLASQAVSEPLTQYMLDSHHRSVSGGTNKSGIVRPLEIMSARPKEREESPEMQIRGLVKGGDGVSRITNDPAILQTMADELKLLNLKQLTHTWEVLYEPFPSTAELTHGKPGPGLQDSYFPDYISDWAWIHESARGNPLLKVPENLTQWCFRFVLDRMQMVMKRISLETVVTRLREAFPTIYIVHTVEGRTKFAPGIVVRVYLSAAVLRRTATSKVVSPEKVVDEFFESLYYTPLRGLPGISDARVEKSIKHQIVAEGPDAGKLEREASTHVIKTVGTNLHEALLYECIDKNSLVSSSIGETIMMYGIEAGRIKIVNEIRRVMGGRTPNLRHLYLYADQMTRTGRHTPFEIAGIVAREPNNTMLGSLAHGPVAAFTRAALEGIVNPIYGIATPLMLGSIPKVGTGSVQFAVDNDYVAQRRKSVRSVIESL